MCKIYKNSKKLENWTIGDIRFEMIFSAILGGIVGYNICNMLK